METIFQAPFIWIKAWNKKLWKSLTWHCCICCNPANGRVDFEEWSAYKIQRTENISSQQKGPNKSLHYLQDLLSVILLFTVLLAEKSHMLKWKT
jgi:hypothetical protein